MKIEIDRDVLVQALAQLEINRTNFRKGPSKSICKMLAGGNDEAITTLRAAIERQSVPAGSLALDAAIGYIERHTPHLVYSEIKAALAAAPQPQPERCKYCDGTGDVHSITGEWRGVCDCEAGKAQPQPVQPTNCRHCGGPENVLCAGQCGPAKGEKQ